MDAERAGRGLAEKLNHLFKTVRRGNGQEYSNEHVASPIRRTGVTVSQSYIWQLRKERKTNPTLKHLQALADFFGVPAAYFFEDEVTSRVTRQLDELAAERKREAASGHSREVKLMALRAGELSEEGRRRVMDILDVVYRLEQAERRAAAPDGA
ncbi:helix-turn-helix domain-containing protein [Streptomyces sp. CB02923]|uniref:helix-turn-helix domain-containing protein n=1 Tax=Streptomyces sp. CB02923 TaxID=1718985 RepID=UPI001F5BDEC2|nr:helix-turn-helix domain-containing protein [Streptomyces sp. CB02923]